jgi:hypothetical protein
MRFLDEGDHCDGTGESRSAAAIKETNGFRDPRFPARPTSWSSRGPKVDVVHPPTYRKVIAGWTDDWRERWGYRANSLEENGFTWRDAETQAFVEILNEIRESSDSSSQGAFARAERSATVSRTLTED